MRGSIALVNEFHSTRHQQEAIKRHVSVVTSSKGQKKSMSGKGVNQHGGGGRRREQLGDSVEDPSCQTQFPVDVFGHFSRGLHSQRARARATDLFQH